MDFSKLSHGFVNLFLWICLISIKFLCCFYWFVKLVTCFSRYMPNKTKLKFDQDFKACWSFCFELAVLSESKYSMPWVRCAFGHVYLYQSMICSVVSPLPILNSRMLLPWSDYCSRTKSKNPFRARGTFVLQGTFVWMLWRSGVCNEMRWWWDSLVDKGPHCLCWSCWTADEQLGRSPAGRGKVRVGCDKNICICICICICWIDEQDERSTPQSWKKGHKWLAGCDKKSGTLLSPFWWKVPPTTTFHLLCVTKNFGVHLLCLWWMWGDV